MCRYLILHQLLVGIQEGLDCGENDLLGLASVSCSSGFEKGEDICGDLYVCGFHVRHLARVSKTQDVPDLKNPYTAIVDESLDSKNRSLILGHRNCGSRTF